MGWNKIMRKKMIARLLTILLILILILASGCGISDEGKVFVEDKAVQEEAANKIIQKADSCHLAVDTPRKF
jgi:hypothetical protein